MYNIYSKFRSSGYDFEKQVKTEKEAINEVEKLIKKYNKIEFPTFSEAFYEDAHVEVDYD